MATVSKQGKSETQERPERRGQRRNRVLKGGLLTFNRGFGALECVVRDQTEAGARLVFGETTAVPPSFTLRIGADGPRFATVRWRSTRDVGVTLD